ncbi:MAG: hypothetical protein H7226_13470 [Salinibacterium sp.]|nr:hypothetical protein [Salinibacterium sp.]
MNLLAGKRIVLTQGELFNFAGSETVTYELAEYFSIHGAEVIVVTHGFGLEWLREFTALDNVRVYQGSDPELRETLEEGPVDIAWIHHQLIPEQLLRHPGGTAFVFHHMSAQHPGEYPISYRIEEALASSILFPAQETLDAHAAGPLLESLPPGLLAVLGNPAPERFNRPKEPSPALQRLLVISNHIPDELADAVAALPEGIEVRILGNEADRGGVSRRVTPEDLAWADAVVSIGKSVQYSLVSAVPVYCYDYFGGPGWLDEENFAPARYANFSGRGFDRKTATTIADELINRYAAATDAMQALRAKYSADFLLDDRIGVVLRGVTAFAGPPLSARDIEAHLKMQDQRYIFTNVNAGLAISTGQLTEKLKAAVEEVESLRSLLAAEPPRARIPELIKRRFSGRRPV